ncbi:hypothetical protein MP213Fo_06240 [Pseudochrobactrum sp. MP213Fo]
MAGADKYRSLSEIAVRQGLNLSAKLILSKA